MGTVRKLRWLAFSCLHCPYHNNEAVSWMLDQIGEWRPDVIVHLGDGHEAAAASRFSSNEYAHYLREEYAFHNNILKDIRKKARSLKRGKEKPRLIFLLGNHEDNLLASDANRIPEDIRDLIDFRNWEEELENWEMPHARYVNDKRLGTVTVGHVTFAHGYEHGVNADELQALRLCEPYRLFVSGHTHRPLAVTQAKRTARVVLPYWYANAGCLRSLNPEYSLRKDTSRWGHAVVVGETEASGRPTHRVLWDAETRILHRANGWR